MDIIPVRPTPTRVVEPAQSPSSPAPQPLLEICVETLPEAIQAVECGATRLEVCSCMRDAGTTASVGLVSAIVERLRVPAFAMVRPRGGDFVFTDEDLDVMCRDIDALRSAGAAGIVSGALSQGGTIDVESTKRLVDASAPLPMTFHRAFDLVPHMERALDQLQGVGVRRILTSGGASTAMVGADAIGSLVRRGGDAVTVIAGGSIRAENVGELVRRTGVTEVHARPTRLSRPADLLRDVSLGTIQTRVQRQELDPVAVRALAQAIRQGA